MILKTIIAMLDLLINKIGGDWHKFEGFVERIKIPPRTTLLCEGDISRNIYIIEQGALRLWFNKDGKDITFQFFFEGRAVASIDSFLNNTPSLFSLESIEPTEALSISKSNFKYLLQQYPMLKDEMFQLLVSRCQNYAHLFLSRIKNSPQEKYKELMCAHPEIIQRVPQHYIASYLGITPISLSRIKNRKLLLSDKTQ